MAYQVDPRKKRRGPEIHTGGVQENVARILAQVEAGEKVTPPKKQERTKRQRPPITSGVCSGCQRPLHKDHSGRTYHPKGFITDTETCPYAVRHEDEQLEEEYNSVKTITGSAKTGWISPPTYWFFETPPVIVAAEYEHDVPDWAYFANEDLL